MNQFRLLLRWFDNPAHMAAFFGVPSNTMHSWLTGRRQPSSAAIRLLLVARRIEATDLWAVLVEQSRPAPRPPRAPRKARVRGVNVYTVAPSLPVRPAAPRGVVWDDAYWFPRTVSAAEDEEGMSPAVVDSTAMLNGLTEDQEAAYWRSLAEYERRTGRVKPE